MLLLNTGAKENRAPGENPELSPEEAPGLCSSESWKPTESVES